jgi:hypothetical protein
MESTKAKTNRGSSTATNGVASTVDLSTPSQGDPPKRERAPRCPAMVDDPVFGPRRADVTHWRCRRAGTGASKKSHLLWREGTGIEGNEWPIESLIPDALSQRWGAGQYIVQYMKMDESGLRKPWGRSRTLSVVAPPGAPAPAVAQVEIVKAPLPTSAAAAPLPPTTDLAQLFSLLAFLEERGEKARAAAAADAKLQQERYRTDVELIIERERLASKERIAQLEVQTRAQPPAPAPAQPLDHEAAAQRTRELVREEVRNAMQMRPYQYDPEDDDDDKDDEPGSSPRGEAAALVAAIREIKEGLQPFLPIILAKLGTPNGPPLAAPATGPAGDGTGNREDPNGQPQE